VSRTVLPGSKPSAQAWVHEIPAGLLVTFPEPTTATATRAYEVNFLLAVAWPHSFVTVSETE
jgi:hypothetical protein